MVDSPSLWSLVPPLKRAREYHLYDYRGNRYLDLYLNRGRCLLGHRPEGVFAGLKNTLSKGPAAEYPSLQLQRYLKLLSLMFPEFEIFRVYHTLERALAAIRKVTGDSGVEVTDPLDALPGQVQWWRPFAPPAKVRADIILPVIPFPSSAAPVAVGFRTGDPPDSDYPAPFFSAALAKALGSLASFGRGYHEDLWRSFDNPDLWERKGPYLLFHSRGKEYQELFETFLRKGILLPPESPAVGIVPGNFTAGEIAPIIKLEKK